jgi:hypothetical protein
VVASIVIEITNLLSVNSKIAAASPSKIRIFSSSDNDHVTEPSVSAGSHYIEFT